MPMDTGCRARDHCSCSSVYAGLIRAGDGSRGVCGQICGAFMVELVLFVANLPPLRLRWCPL